MPVAVTLKLAVWPATTAKLAGCFVIEGAAGVPVEVLFEFANPPRVRPMQPVSVVRAARTITSTAAKEVRLGLTAKNILGINVGRLEALRYRGRGLVMETA